MKLTIENFQSYKSAEFDFVSPGINAIVGQNGHGKSAALRAISSLCLGTTLSRKHKTKTTSVELDGCRRFFDSKNKYSVDGTIFEAMRKATPTQVTDRLRLRDVNFRSQHQPYFLLAESSGAVARAMNELTDLGVIDYVSSALKSEGSALSWKKTLASENLESERKLITETDWAIEADEDLKVIESLETEIVRQSNQIKELSDILCKVFALSDKLNTLPDHSWADLFYDSKNRVSDTDIIQLGALCETVDDYANWLLVCDVDFVPQFTQVQNLMSKSSEIEFLDNLIGRLVEYSQDLALCPNPESDIDLLKGISIDYPTTLEELVSESLRFEETLITLGKTKNMSDDLLAVQTIADGVTAVLGSLVEVRDILFKTRELESQSADLEFEYWTAQEKVKEAFREAGKCPLCGGDV